ncbi:nucleolar protein 14 [Nephila pilipes]|uniref:Nucleolar protein 14 n=1 Tax=Nephila pilipes TaxID=299642 RepID=A0A8X6MZW7_NEPPI|nr:nucleolar protein 14 [Nephila pilipes]
MVKQVFKKKISFKGEENPFNLKLNREKHSVLGKTVKGTKGLRCISRAQSHLKRKSLYNKAKKTSQKANNFVDRRLFNESAEDSATARFVQERKKKFKKDKFNLNEEELTHKGVPLHAVKNLDEELGSDDDEQLDAAFVNKAHFGGFPTKNQEALSHKEIIDQLINESKQKKHEKKIEKELTIDLTEKLDFEWKNLLIKVQTNKKGSLQGTEPILTNKKVSLQVTDKQEPKQVTNKKSVQLTDKELLETNKVKQMLIPDKQQQLSKKNDAYDVVAEQLRYTMRSTPGARVKTAEELEKEEQEKQFKLETERRSRMADDKEVKANFNDHLSADSILDDFDLQPITEDDVNEKSASDEDSEYSDSDNESVDSQMSDNTIEGEVSNKVESMSSQSEAKNCDTNVLFNIPANMGEFEEYLEVHNCVSSEEKLDGIEKILKPCLNAKSEAKLSKLVAFFGILIEYGLKHLKNNPTISENLITHLFDIAKVTPVKTSEKILFLLDQEQELFQNYKAKKKKNNFPKLEVILLFKYCSALYSVSDFTHPIITPVILFMCNILSSQFFITFQNIESRLCICSIILDCVTQSKRLVPEVICFLNKLLKCMFPCKDESTKKATERKVNLIISEKQTCNEINDINCLKPNESLSVNSRKLSIILKSVNLLQKFAVLYQHLPSFHYLFKEILSNCSLLPIEYYPDVLKNVVSHLIQEIEKNDTKFVPLTFPKVKPKPLKLFEPSYESKFNKKDDIKKKLKILKNVSQKIKKEEKDILRQMRRDMQVVSSEKLKEQLESDAERKRKVKELYHELSTQEGEYKKLMKKKP